MATPDQPARPQEAGDSPLMRAVAYGASRRPRDPVPLIAGAALEVALMFGLSMIGPTQILGLPGPLSIGIASVVGVVTRPWQAVVVAVTGCLAYDVFLSQFGVFVPYHVVAASSVLWIGMPWLIARAGHSLRQHASARQSAQAEMDDLYRGLEQGLLPRRHPEHPLLQATTFYRPGEQRLRLGGDFFDLSVLDDGSLALVVGDVSGHGSRAAALGAMLRGTWRGAIDAGLRRADVARVLDHVVAQEGAGDMHVTALFAAVTADGKRLDVISAGHPPPLLLTEDITALAIARSVPLGLADFADGWPQTTVDLPDTWALFCYTDGLTELRLAPGSPERFDVEGLIAQLAKGDGHLSSRDDLRALVDAMAAQGGEGPPDDVAIVLIRR